MKNIKTLYWIVTALMAAFMLLSAVPDILRVPQALAIFGHLGYPAYLLPLLGAAKTLAVLTVLAIGAPTLREWAYAGLVFDVAGALYSHVSVGDPASAWAPALVALSLVLGSYAAYRVRLQRGTVSPA